jgi:formate hydrogenlyase subunit 3/multisubunit Na+/H+ antiporter MnhD subunit
MGGDAWLPLAVAVPLMGGLAAFVAGAGRSPAARRYVHRIGLTASVASAAVGLIAAGVAWRAGPLAHALGGWPAPLGIVLAADALAALMLGLTAIVGLMASMYTAGYFAPASDAEADPADALLRAARFWPLWLGLWAALAALFLSADLFNVYVALELLTLTAVGLVASAGGAAVSAALRYLLWALAGSLLYLAGVALLYGATGTLAFETLAARLAPSPAANLGAALVLAGVAIKGALFPLHAWLPHAHAQAPAPVSAVLSALVVKTSFYLVWRLAGGDQAVFAPLDAATALGVLGWLGAGAVVWGSVQALVQVRLKMLIAYSTIAQLGYMYLALALALPAAGLYLALSHAFAKAALFLGAGAVLHVYGQDRLDALGGVAHRMPVTLFTFGLAGVSLIGLPPSGGFIGKWLLLERSVAGGHWGLVAVLVAGTLAAAGYVFRVIGSCLAATQAPRQPTLAIELAALLLALAAIALGFMAPPLLAPVG